MRARAAALLALLLVPAPVARAAELPAPTGPFAKLTVDDVMRGPRWVGSAPSGLRWSGDSKRLWFEWRKAGEDEDATFVVDAAGGTPRRLTDDERRLAPAPGALWDREHRHALFVDRGDVVLVDSIATTRRQLTHTEAAESDPRFARRGTAVTFVRDNDVFVVPLGGSGDLVDQLAVVGPKKPDAKPTDSQAWLKSEEKQLLQWVKKAAEKRARDEQREKQHAVPRLEAAAGESVEAAALSPDDRHLFVVVSSKAEQAKTALVPRYVSESAYTEDIPTRTNVGDTQAQRRLGVLDLQSGETTWASTSFAGPVPTPRATAAPSASPASEPSPAPAPAAAAQPVTPPSDRPVWWELPIFNEDGSAAVAWVRSQDNKDRWIVAVDPASGAVRVLDHLHDDAWVRWPDALPTELGFLPDQKHVWFLSERTGWQHLYVVPVAGGEARALTSGTFEIDAAELTPDRRGFAITSNEAHPGERHLSTLGLDGGARTRVTSIPGANLATISPDGQTLGLVVSRSNRPEEVYLAPNRPGAAARAVTESPTPEWLGYPWVEPQLVRYKARDGAEVWARLYTPEMVGAQRDQAHPGIVFVHGAGYLQNAHRSWSYYYREYMFHHLLAARGYVVLDPDFRASAGYGRDWRTAVYRHMGGRDLDDVVDGARWLSAHEGVDPKRLGVYGGSYGGFITLMALFTAPDVFRAGAALRPVTDWAHYNHEYTSSILDLPVDDADVYRRSSPIYHAEGLQGALLICHGMVDVNVHYQDSVRLAQRLVELRKTDWELASYPVEDHSFREETSWADEYRRILKLFETRVRGAD